MSDVRDAIYLFMQGDGDDEEIVGFFDADEDSWEPAIAYDDARLEQLKPLMRKIAQSVGTIRLVKYSQGEVVETYEPVTADGDGDG